MTHSTHQPDTRSADRIAAALDDFPLPATVEASRDFGRAARDVVPRKALGAWDSTTRSATALERLFAQHPERVAELLPLRYARMASSPWAYLRGAAAVMAADLATEPHTGLLVQMCGDAHILNYGLWASPERRLLFDLRDFDETLTGPFEWDLKRLTASILVLAKEAGLSAKTADAAVVGAIEAYRTGMQRYAGMGELAVWYDQIDLGMSANVLSTAERQHATKIVTREARKKSNEGVLAQMTAVVDGRRRITDDPPKRVHLEASLADLERVAAQVIETYPVSVPYHMRRLLERFTPMDVVRQVVGVGSVGMRVFLLYLEGQSDRQPLFLQIKQASASVYEPFLTPSPFDNHGERVGVGQRLMQSATDMFVGWTRVEDHDFYVRQFRDAKVIPDSEKVAPILGKFATACGSALAKSHARTGDPTAISAYIGAGGSFRTGILAYARAYAAQTQADHAALRAAVRSGEVTVAERPW